MPRPERIDFPGAIHHVVSRGNERREIFWDDFDRRTFLKRLEKLCLKTGARCYAWALIPNHFHFLLEMGTMRLSQFMHGLLTAYTHDFNRRHHRVGHVFQGRFWNRICDRDSYFLSVIRYIHLNPYGAGLAKDLDALDRFRWCGHGAILGKRSDVWQDTLAVLKQFGMTIEGAQREYRRFIEDGLKKENVELKPSLLFRNEHGKWEPLNRKLSEGRKEQLPADSGLLMPTFQASDQLRWVRNRWERLGFGIEKVVEIAAAAVGISAIELLRGGKSTKPWMARSLCCYWLIEELEFKLVEVSKYLRIGSSTVRHNIAKGFQIAQELGLDFERDFLIPFETKGNGAIKESQNGTYGQGNGPG